MNQTLKRYLISSATTFVTAFLISVGAQLTMANLSPANLGWGIVISIAVAGLRAGVKAVVESLTGTIGDPQTNLG